MATLSLAELVRQRSPLPDDFQDEVLEVNDRICKPVVENPFLMFGHHIEFAGKQQLDWLFNELYIEACYYFMADNDRPVILDCGSNIGLSVLFFKKLYPDARIVAFEPDPATFALLSRNVAGFSNVTLHQSALSNETREISFFRELDKDLSNLCMSALPNRFAGGVQIKVPAVRLSDYIDGTIDLLKLDIEGFEYRVMTDLVRTGKIQHVARAHIEYHHHIDKSVDHFASFLQLLEDNGFGYQIRTDARAIWPNERSFQDVALYCYHK